MAIKMKVNSAPNINESELFCKTIFWKIIYEYQVLD